MRLGMRSYNAIKKEEENGGNCYSYTDDSKGKDGQVVVVSSGHVI